MTARRSLVVTALFVLVAAVPACTATLTASMATIGQRRPVTTATEIDHHGSDPLR